MTIHLRHKPADQWKIGDIIEITEAIDFEILRVGPRENNSDGMTTTTLRVKVLVDLFSIPLEIRNKGL